MAAWAGTSRAGLTRAGHSCVVFDTTQSAIDALAEDEPEPTRSLEAMIEALPCPRTVWLTVPAAAVEPTVRRLAPMLAAGDKIIDGRNSH